MIKRRRNRVISHRPQLPKPDDYPKPTRLEYPVPISYGPRGGIRDKTYAFFRLGSDEHQIISEWHEIVRNEKFGPFKEIARKDFSRARRQMVQTSSHFIRHITPAQQAIRQRLKKLRIPVEEPLMEWKAKGATYELYASNGYKDLGESINRGRYGGGYFIPLEQRSGALQQIGAILTRMHARKMNTFHVTAEDIYAYIIRRYKL